MEPEGVAPSSVPCRGTVLLLNDDPMVERAGVEPAFLRCERSDFPLVDAPHFYSVSLIRSIWRSSECLKCFRFGSPFIFQNLHEHPARCFFGRPLLWFISTSKKVLDATNGTATIAPRLKTLGRHILIELYDCNTDTLKSVEKVRRSMVDAAKVAGCHVVKEVFHEFSPHGVSGVVVVSESHLAIHTWPEHGYAAVDIFTCGEVADPWNAYAFLEKALGAGRVSAMEARRGVVSDEAPVAVPITVSHVAPKPEPARVPARIRQVAAIA